MRSMSGRSSRSGCSMLTVLPLMTLCLVGPASAENLILYTQQANPPGSGGDYPSNTTGNWASEICNNKEKFEGTETEWTPVLDDPGKDAETHLVAVSGRAVYNPDPKESGFCQGQDCPGQPVSCSSDDDCNACGGVCDPGQGPSCSCEGQGPSCSCSSPWTNPPHVGSPIPCVNDAQCVACQGTCTALGRSRGDVQMTHPFGLDWDVAIAPDGAYLSLLSPGNIASTHLSSGDQALPGFGDVVDPYLHATTGARGWCGPEFSDQNRCANDADCSGGTCRGNVSGLGLDPKDLPGVLGLEIDHDLLPDAYQPRDGDRTAVFGRWIVDCGHGDDKDTGAPGFKTEIHPPLLLATGRSTGSGAFGAKCSAEQTCSSVVGRPYLVSQRFGDGFLARHLAHEVEKLGCVEVTGPVVSAVVSEEGPFAGLPDCSLGLNPVCVCNGDAACIACEAETCVALDTFGIGAPFGIPCSTKLEARAKVSGVPFADRQEMQYFIRPSSGRLNPGDRMLAEWHLTARNGVTVALSNGGDAGVLVDVTMKEGGYSDAARPAKQDWVVFADEIPLPLLAFLLLKFPGTAPQALIIERGVFTDRYQAPQAPSNDTAPTVSLADQLDPTVQAAQTIDDSQPFPVSGLINVGWFRCSAGGPYVLDCGGPRTTVTLDGSGSSDPDGNPLTYTWAGPFIGGTATGVMPTVRFNGSGTFPVTLTVSNGTVSTSCTSSVTVQAAAVFQLGGGKVDVTGPAGGIDGDVCVGPSGSLDVTGAQFVTGTIHLAPGDTLTKSGTGLIGPVLRNQDLSARITDTIGAAADLAALPCTQSFARWNTSEVIVGTGGQNVICVGDVTLHGGHVVTLSGGANDTFVVNVTGRFVLTGGSKIVASGVPQSAIQYNVIGAGQQVLLSGPDGGVNCCRTSLDGTVLAVGRAITLAPGLVSGEVISGQKIGITGGASVR